MILPVAFLLAMKPKAEKAILAHLDNANWRDMLEKMAHEFLSRQGVDCRFASTCAHGTNDLPFIPLDWSYVQAGTTISSSWGIAIVVMGV
jgi:hypothetical protein